MSKRAFGALDAHLWRLVYKWARFSHPNKPKRWIIARYFGMFNPARQDKWVFGSRETGFYLRKFAWTAAAGPIRWNSCGGGPILLTASTPSIRGVRNRSCRR